MRRAALSLAFLAASGVACVGRPADLDAPAILTSTSAATRMELLRVVSAALRQSPVLLAEDALVHSSSLLVDQRMPRDASGRPLDGRVMSRPERFDLVRRGTRCVLVQSRTQARWELREASCRELDPD